MEIHYGLKHGVITTIILQEQLNRTENDFVISGYNTNTTSGASGFVVSVDSIGNENWSKDYLSDNIQALDFIELTSDNEYIVIGRESFGNNSECYLLKVSSNNGDVLWKSTFSEGNYNLLNEVTTNK